MFSLLPWSLTTDCLEIEIKNNKRNVTLDLYQQLKQPQWQWDWIQTDHGVGDLGLA